MDHGDAEVPEAGASVQEEADTEDQALQVQGWRIDDCRLIIYINPVGVHYGSQSSQLRIIVGLRGIKDEKDLCGFGV